MAGYNSNEDCIVCLKRPCTCVIKFAFRDGRIVTGPNGHPVVFQEDDALLRDSTYPGIKGWWYDTFGISFSESFSRAVRENSPSIDHGDCSSLMISGMVIPGDPNDTGAHTYFVTACVDGYVVERGVQ